jgi:hypothetical protein
MRNETGIFPARSEYGTFSNVPSGSDIVMKELCWPYWNGGYYNTWFVTKPDQFRRGGRIFLQRPAAVFFWVAHVMTAWKKVQT